MLSLPFPLLNFDSDSMQMQKFCSSFCSVTARGGPEGPPQQSGTAGCWSRVWCISSGSSTLWIGRFWDLHKVALLDFLWVGDNMHCVFSVLPPFVLTRFRAYYPPRVGKSRTLLREGVVDSRFVFSRDVTFVTHFFLRFQILVQHLCLQYSGTAITCVLQVYSTCVFSTVLQHLCVQYSKRVGLKGPAQCIVPAGAHCLV